MRRVITIITLLYLCLPTDSLAKFTVLDSVGVQKVQGQTFVLHRVLAGETLSSISKRYNTNISRIAAANPSISGTTIRVGQVLRVPIVVKEAPKPRRVIVTHVVKKQETLWRIAKSYEVTVGSIKELNGLSSNTLREGQSLQIATLKVPEPPKEEKKEEPKVEVEETKKEEVVAETPSEEKEETPWWAYQPIGEKNSTVLQVAHTIQPGESLAKISKVYNVSVEKLVVWNALSSPNQIKAGDRIIVGYEYIDRTTGKKVLELGDPNAKTEEAKVEEEVNTENEIVIGSNIPSSKKITVMGAVIKGNSATNTNKHLALHRTARKGSYIKVTNPNNGKYTFVRVLGNLQTVDADQDVVIKLSRSASQSLGLVTDKFQLILEYNE